MSRIKRQWLELDYSNLNSLRAENIPYSEQYNIKQMIDKNTIDIDNITNIIESCCSSNTTIFGDYGYIGGGYNIEASEGNEYLSSIEKLQFSTNINSICINVLSSSKDHLSACNSTTYGYFGNGYTGSGNGLSHIDSLNFSNDSVQLLTNYIYECYDLSAANSSQNGYFYGGYNDINFLSTISKLVFFDNTTLQLTNYLSQAKLGSAACNSSVAGYIGGGIIGDYVTTIEKQIFSTETLSIVSNLQMDRYCLSSFNSSTYGYFAGGHSDSYGVQSSIERLDFTSNSIATMTAVLSRSTYFHCSCNNSTNGYITGFRYSGTYFSNIDKYVFSNDSVSTLAATLNITRSVVAACQIGDFY